MAVIEYEERASISGDLTFVAVNSQLSALSAGAGDAPQPDHLVKTDAALVEEMLASTKPVSADRFAG